VWKIGRVKVRKIGRLAATRYVLTCSDLISSSTAEMPGPVIEGCCFHRKPIVHVAMQASRGFMLRRKW